MSPFSRFVSLTISIVSLLLPAFSVERSVDLTAADGTKLKASFFAAAKPGPGVLLLHQCNRQRKVWDNLAQQLADAGINVLTLDLRGYGESAGERFEKASPDVQAEMRTHWSSDIDKAFEFLTSQPGVQRDTIGVGGASCGVNNAVQTARRHPEVQSLVLLSGGADLDGRKFLRDEKNIPIFFAIAEDDEFPAAITAVEWLYTITGNPAKKFLRYPKGGHGADIFPVQPDLPKQIVDWFVTTLVKTPGKAPIPETQPKLSSAVQMLDMLDHPGGGAKLSQMLAEDRKAGKPASFAEADVNFLGYEHIQSGDVKGGIEILKINAEAFPNSPNVYDSLGDAYLADGQRDLALQNTKKTLDLLATDTTDDEQRRKLIRTSAEQKLKQLGESK